MLDLIEKVMLTGLGAVALSQKKVDELVNDLKSHYRLSEEEGRALLERLTTVTRESREKAAEIIEAEVTKVVERLGLVLKSDHELLLKRVEALERSLNSPQGGE